MFRFRATKRDFFTIIVSTRFVAKSACVFQPVVLFDLEKTEGENTPVRGASVREESETIFVLSGVLLRVVVQKIPRLSRRSKQTSERPPKWTKRAR